MRLAFIAAAAQVECRVQRRRRRRRRRRQRKALVLHNSLLNSIFQNNHSAGRLTGELYRQSEARRLIKTYSDGSSTYNNSYPTPPTEVRPGKIPYQLSSNSIGDSIFSLSPREKIVHSSTAYRRKAWPFLAFWHLGSLILFLLSATLISASSSAASNENMDEDRFWTPPAKLDPYTDRSDDTSTEIPLFEETDNESTDRPDSCHRYDYFLSPTSYGSSSGSNIVRRSVDGSSSPFHAAPKPAVDNVFAIWLRASRYGGDRAWSSSFDRRSADEDDSETSWPLPRPRTRHRYQHYRNIQNSRASTRKWPSTASPSSIPRAASAPSPRIRVSLSSQPARPKATMKKKPAAFQVGPRKQSTRKFPQCKVFDEACIDELCSLEVAKRVEELRNVYVKTNMAQREASVDSSSNTNTTSNVTLYEFFALDVQKDWQLRRPSISHLSDGLRACVLSDPVHSRDKKNSSAQCRTCYRNVLTRLKQIDSRHQAFSQSVLSMIDCEPDNDLERFSPTSNCSECKLWYRRWLLVIFSDIWRQKPCLQWCNLAELACPHLPPVRKNDYAGLPSFRCTDPEISLLAAGNSTYGPPCDCVHPCDAEAYTKHWRWNIIGDYETREFCRDYQKRDKKECPAKKTSKKPSTQAPKTTKGKGRVHAGTKAPRSGTDGFQTLVPIWLLPLCVSAIVRDYGR